jgi:hypothetical protein
MDEQYKKAIEAAEKDLQGWFRLRNAADQRIAQLKSAITILNGLLEGPPKASPQEVATEEIGDMGITEAVRTVLRTSPGVCATPADVKEDLIGMKFDLSGYRNPSAVIHNTLKRLDAQGEVVAVDTPSGTGYMLKESTFGAELARYAATHPFGDLGRFAKFAEDQLRSQEEAAQRAAVVMKPSEAARGAAEAMLSPGVKLGEFVAQSPKPPKPPGSK